MSYHYDIKSGMISDPDRRRGRQVASVAYINMALGRVLVEHQKIHRDARDKSQTTCSKSIDPAFRMSVNLSLIGISKQSPSRHLRRLADEDRPPFRKLHL